MQLPKKPFGDEVMKRKAMPILGIIMALAFLGLLFSA